jgi:uncharacterized protein
MGAILWCFNGVFSQLRLNVWRSSVIALVVFASSGCAWIDHKQRELIYRPSKVRPESFQGLKAGDVAFDLALPGEPQQRLHLWWLPHTNPEAPTLLYLHGTFRNLYYNHRKMEALRSAGFAVLAVEYRGWGDSSVITPSEATIDADAQVAWVELVRRQPDPKKRVIFGHSMGTGVAVELASGLSQQSHSQQNYAGLILEASFTRLPDVAKEVGVLGTVASWFATQEFNSVAKINNVTVPILMMHGTADNTVPIVLGRRLFEASSPGQAQWVEFEGGSHSGLDAEAPQRYAQAVRGLIQKLPAALPAVVR